MHHPAGPCSDTPGRDPWAAAGPWQAGARAAWRKAVAVLSAWAGLGLVLLAAGGCSTGAGGTNAGPRVALVIGNFAYENAPVLVNPGNDAADMCAELRRLGFRTLCHTNVRDRAAFEAHVQQYLALLGTHGVGVVFYAGHGVQAANASYLVPTRAQPDEAAADPLRVLYGVDDLFDRLRQHQERTPQRFQLVVLDACRNDLFADDPPAAPVAPGAAAVPPAPSATAAPTTSASRPAAGRGQAPQKPQGPSARSRLVRALQTQAGAGNGLAPIKDAPPRTIVLYATAAREAAFDGEGRNGPLTKHVLAHIGTRGLLVEDMIKRVTAGVEADTLRDFRKRQTPFTYGSFSGRFCFAGCPGEADVPPAF